MDIYFKSILMHIKCELEYKTSFILLTIGTAISSILSFVVVYILLDKFGTINEWSIYEVALTYAIAILGHAVTEMFGRGFDTFHKEIKNGTFDRMLIRPRSLTMQVACNEFAANKLGRIIEGIIILIVAIINIDIVWSLDKILVLSGMIIGSMAIFLGILLIKAAFSFWTIEGMEVMNILSDGGRELSQYPINVYEKWFSFIFTYIIPFGLINYYPLMYLLNKGNVEWWCALTPLIAMLFLIPCFLFWRFGIKQYKSTGS